MLLALWRTGVWPSAMSSTNTNPLQIRTWLHTPVLHSASSIVENMHLAQRTVGFAKETIRYLSQLNKTTDIYHRIQTFYHQFLTSAISVLFLASTHAPLRFSADCRGEFYMALDLVKDMSSKAWVSQRLWKTIRSLKAYAPSLGLEEDTGRSSTRRQRGMGAVMSPNVGQLSGGFGSDGSRTGMNGSMASTPQWVDEGLNNGLRLQTEMSKIYEGFTGFDVLPGWQTLQRSHIFPAGDKGVGGGSGSGLSPGEVGGGSSGGVPSPGSNGSGGMGGGIYQQMKDMF